LQVEIRCNTVVVKYVGEIEGVLEFSHIERNAHSSKKGVGVHRDGLCTTCVATWSRLRYVSMLQPAMEWKDATNICCTVEQLANMKFNFTN